jgi:hypothetical protein
MGDYDTSFPGEDETLGWFSWLFKPKARTPASTPYTYRTKLKQEINTLIAKRTAVLAKLRAADRDIIRLVRRAGLYTLADELESAMGDDTLGWNPFGVISWLWKRKPKTATDQLAELRRKRSLLYQQYVALHRQITAKKALYNRYIGRLTLRARAVRARAVGTTPAVTTVTSRKPAPFQPAAAAPIEAVMTGLTAAERKELNRRMRWGWAQRPGAPDKPGEAEAMRASLSRYKYNLATRIKKRLIAERRMGWAKRPGAPDMPGEAEAMFKKYGVTLGSGSPRIDDELIL